MKIEKIKDLYKEYHVPEHVILHMQKVAYICEIFANELIKKGEIINTRLLVNAALLHDLLRVCDFSALNLKNFSQNITDQDIAVWQRLREKYGAKGHIHALKEILYANKEKELADLTVKHGFFEIDNLHTWEEKILYYADKRVDGDNIVILKKRFNEGRKRNLSEKSKAEIKEIEEIETKVYKLEQEFIHKLGKLPL